MSGLRAGARHLGMTTNADRIHRHRKTNDTRPAQESPPLPERRRRELIKGAQADARMFRREGSREDAAIARRMAAYYRTAPDPAN